LAYIFIKEEINCKRVYLEGFGADGLGGLLPLPEPDGFPVVLGPFGGLCVLIL